MAEDILVEANIPIDPSKLYKVGNKIVHPLTLTENDNGHYLLFKIDFDGADPIFIESDHKLDIAVTKAQDVTIPLLVDYPTDTPQDISQLSYAIWDRYQFYQFAMDVNAKSVLFVETPDMATNDIEITIANKAPGVEQLVWKTNPNTNVGHAKGWYFEAPAFVVVQVRVPIGLNGLVSLGQRSVIEPLMGVSQAPNGTLTADPASPVLSLEQRGAEYRLMFNYTTNNARPVIQLFDEVTIGQAIAAYRVNGIFFAQGVSEIRDYVADSTSLLHRGGKTGAWLFVDLITADGYASNTKPGMTSIQFPVDEMSMYDKHAVFEFVTGGVNVHYYLLDSNLVPVSYIGHNFIPWLYDETKPITVINRGSVAAIGNAYDVAEGDLGPLRTDFIVSHNYDVVVTDVTEV